MMNRRKLSFRSTGVALSLSLALLLQHPMSVAGPSDMVGFGTASSLGAAGAPRGQSVEGGDNTVASSTGAYEYGFPIVVPPGRLGMQPALSLNYTSQGSIYGSLASQWTMPIPEMRVDYSIGSLAAPETADNELPWIGGLTGGHRLVPVVEPSSTGSSAYRAEVDNSYVRYEKFPEQGPGDTGPLWIARTLDGRIRYFGDSENIRDPRGERAYLGDRAPLTREEDQFGNVIDYYWSTSIARGDDITYESPASYQIEKIEYTKNANVASGDHFAEVFFEYGAKVYCGGAALAVGGVSDYHGGILRVEGELPLNNIITSVADDPGAPMREVRRVHLDYNEDQCTPNFSPIRQLVRITETGKDKAGVAVSTNPIEFSYGPTARPYDHLTTFDSSAYAGGTTAKPQSLTWGRRGDHPLENTMESMLIDLDGDGRLDRIFSDYGAFSGPARNASRSGTSMDGCGMVWLRNDGAEFSRDPIDAVASSSSVPIKLPRINWREGEALPDPGKGERCSLTGQVTGLRTVLGPDETSPAHLCDPYSSTQLVYRFMDVDSDGLPDLVTALSYDADLYDPANDPSWPPTTTLGTVNDGSVDDPLVEPNGSSAGCSGGLALEPEVSADSSVMYWYPNKGPELGFFDLTTPIAMFAPIALSANVGSSTDIPNSTTIRMSFGPSSFTDIDGDGNIDAVWSDGFNNTAVRSSGQIPDADFPTFQWGVHLGDGKGGFHRAPNDGPYDWAVPDGAQVSTEVLAHGTTEGLTHSLSELVDVNADGLVDLVYWYNEEPKVIDSSSYNQHGSSRIYLNNGQGFEHTGFWDQAKLTNDLDRPASTTSMSAFLDNAASGTFNDAIGESRIRLSDFDSDGRPDLLSHHALGLWFDPAPNDPWQQPYDMTKNPKIYINPGLGTLLTPPSGSSSSIVTAPGFMQHRVELSEFEWEVKDDFIDLNGDGEPETVEPMDGQASGFNLNSRDTAEQPLRLLNQIENGQGGVTAIRYAAHNAPSVAAASQVDYAVMPNHIWVVKDVTRTDSISGTTGVSKVKYGDPVWNQDSHLRWGFRGFTSIETSGLHGVGELTEFPVTERKYDYSKDWSGRLKETVVYPNGFPDGFTIPEAASISRNTFANPFSLFGGAVLSYQIDKSETWNCLGPTDGTFLSYVDCSTRAATLTQETSWAPSFSDSGAGTNPTLAFHAESTKIFSFGDEADGSKGESRVYRLYSDATHYWQAVSKVDSTVKQGLDYVPVASTTSIVDATNRYYEFVQRRVDATTITTERTTRDTNTGLVQFFRNPNNQGTPTPMTYVYDAFEMYPTSITNYLGHVDTRVSDMGTGAVLEAYGPNALPCDAKYGTKTRYDGLGRPVEVKEVRCSGDLVAEPVLSTMAYVEFASVLAPAHVTTTLNLDSSDTPQTVVSTTYVDGSGRTFRTEIEDGNPGDPITSISEFNNKGQLFRTTGPDPSTESLPDATVATVYTYDSLGRVIKTRDDASNTGVDHEYRFDIDDQGQGPRIIETTTEVVFDTGPAGETTVYSDVFGRMVRVDELTNTGLATTKYEYDDNDNVKKITDADNIITEMEHDQLSRRKKVKRGEREWTYAYDPNGNLIVETAPNTAGETADNPGFSFFSTSTVYDALDRVDSRAFAPRGLSPEQLNDFDAQTVDYHYETYKDGSPCPNGIGKLCEENAGSNLTKTYKYDYAGRVVEETQAVSLPPSVVDFGVGSTPFAPVPRTTHMEYNLAGAITDVYLADGPDKTSSTHVSYTFDAVGAPKEMTAIGPSGVTSTIVNRNKAQRIRQQITGCLERIWEYDHKGRVTKTFVKATDCGVGGAQ